MKILHKFIFLVLFGIIFFVTSSYGQEHNFIMTRVGPNNMLNKPWDIHYGPDDYLWVTERENGIIFRVDPSNGLKNQILKIDDVFSTGRQDGLLGIALHNDILGDHPYVYLSYTYLNDGERKQRIVRYTYEISSSVGVLSLPMILIDNLPASNDHNTGRLIFGPDEKLYYSIGDQGGNQNSNYCNPVLSQVLPTQEEIDNKNWSNYPGKILRINLEGSIPDDNPMLQGVRSHIYSYGHRNAQGLVFSSSGRLYSDEHGPDTDDEVNMITSGSNYGWPRVVGFKDDQAYDFCNWSSLSNCSELEYNKFECPEGAEFLEESTFTDENYKEPLFSMFAVSDDYDFDNPMCESSWICRPNVAPSSIGIYESDAIPSMKNSLLVTSLKRGRVYILQLDEEGIAILGDTSQFFYTENRYRDIVVDPNGKSFYVITDQEGNTSDASGNNIIRTLKNPGTILKFALEEDVSNVHEAKPAIFNIWPNPAKAAINIAVGDVGNSLIQGSLINTSGNLLRNFELQPGINRQGVEGLSPGMYFLRIKVGQETFLKKVVVR